MSAISQSDGVKNAVVLHLPMKIYS